MNNLDDIQRRFIEAMSRIAQFWGFPRALGAVYGALYLAPGPLSLDELVALTSVTKGAVSTHVRSLDQLQMIRKHIELGDRKDYYVAETRLWVVVKQVLAQRRQAEFDQALRAVRELAAAAHKVAVKREHASQKALYVARLEAMQSFFDTLDGIVGTVLALDELRLTAARKVLGGILVPPRKGAP